MADGEKRARGPLISAFVASQVVVLGVLVGPLLGRGWLSGFRQWAYPDQLSYAAIATNVANGDFSLVEPFTQTGNLFYPSGWYLLMGSLSFVTGLPVHLAWTIMGLTLVCVTVFVAGWAAWRMSGHAWAPLLPSLALLTGTLAGAFSGTWYVELLNHAVLWGPLASLFTLNAEITGICIVVLAMTLVQLEVVRARPPRPWIFVVAAALIGLVANVQTYSFFSGLVLAVAFVTSYALLVWRSRTRLVATLTLVIVVLLAGPWFADRLGRLPVLALLVVAMAVGAAPFARHYPLWSAATVGALAVTAGPQLVRTALGIAADDPFLSYRTVSSAGLGVAIPTGLVAATVFILAGVACALVLSVRSDPAKASLVLALALGLALMSQNDRWGFNQEPYRFWVVFVILSALLLTPILAWAITAMRSMTGLKGAFTRAVAVVTASLWIVSLLDTVLLIPVLRSGGVFSMSDDRATALSRLAADAPADGLMLGSRCLEPQVFKNIVQRPVAHYNKGLAWPVNEPALRPFIVEENRAGDSVTLLQRAGISSVITASNCPDDWSWSTASLPTAIATTAYVDETGHSVDLTLWVVPPRDA